MASEKYSRLSGIPKILRDWFVISIIIPTYNASWYIKQQLNALLGQNLKHYEIFIVDSSSSDHTVATAKACKIRVTVIRKSEFDHGGTRTLAGKQTDGEILVYLTQDAIPLGENAVDDLVRPLREDEKVGAAYGRQIPHQNATPFAAHLRAFNYPTQSYVRNLSDKATFGLKTAFCSNSFAAYKRSALENVGWFKEKLIFGEDIHTCARMLGMGYKVAYVAEAAVSHSHNYSLCAEMKRYFDTGVFHKTENWLLEEFGGPEKEGVKYMLSEMRFLLTNRLPHLIPQSILRGILKFAGYKLGYHYDKLPDAVTRRLSLHRRWVGFHELRRHTRGFPHSGDEFDH